MEQIPRTLFNRNKAHKALQRRSICLTDSYHDFILDEIKRRYTIEYEKDMSVYD